MRGSSSEAGGSGAPSHRLRILFAAFACAVSALAISASGAGAFGFHPFVETFGSAAQPTFNALRVAVSQDTGDVYVMDGGSTSLKRYNADGTPANFSALGTNVIDGKEGPDATPQNGLSGGSPGDSQIAIDSSGGPTDGDIYVTERSTKLVDIFSSTGAYLGHLSAAGANDFTKACGVAVDSSGAVYVGDYESGIHKFVPSANPPVNADNTANFTTTTNPCTLAAGAGPTAGFLFAAQYEGPISKIDSSSGELKYSFSSGVTTISVNPASGDVYAVRASEFVEFDATGAGSARQRSADALKGTAWGIAVRGSNGNVYVSNEQSSNLEVYGALTIAPTPAIGAASGVSATAATLNGTVNPEGTALTECKFEWGLTTQGGYPNSTPCEQAPPADSSDHAVSAQITGLAGGGSEYRFRLVAKNAAAGETSATETFVIGARILGTAASVGTDEATLRGAIDPNGEAAIYKFEWGSTPAYGNTTAPQNIPSGGDPVAVSVALGGLTPGATYHYRLVAENATDTTTEPDRTFTTLASVPPLGPSRAYELVSPYPTGGVPLLANNAKVSVSEDGNRVHFGSPLQPLAGSKLVPPRDHLHNVNSWWRYGSLRDADGWHVEEYGLGSNQGDGISADGKRYLFSTNAGWENFSRLDPDDRGGSLEGVADPSSFEVYERKPDGSLVWLSRDPRIPAGTPQAEGSRALTIGVLGVSAMSVDGSTAVFRTRGPLDDADTIDSDGNSLYKWEEGRLRFIGIRPDGSVPSNGSNLGDGEFVTQGTVSRDGKRVLFNAERDDSPPPGKFQGHTLYIQTDGQPTVEAVKETGVPSLPNGQPFDVHYRGASADLSRAFFTSSSRLTPDSGASATESGNSDLYAYDINADKVRDLTPRLDGIDDANAGPAMSDRGRALGLVANSEDGKRVYFVADARYDVAPNPEGELPSPEGRNLYLAELNGFDEPIHLRFVAGLGSDDEAVWQSTLAVVHNKTSYASPDGSVLGFGSNKPLTGQPLGGTNQLFVYDAEADTLECASCPPDGSLPVGDVDARGEFGGNSWQEVESSIKRWVSSDGRVFFHTPSQLVEADTNLVDDVYEYRAGQLRLVSAGTGNRPSRLEDASRDGSTVVFNTFDALVPQDEEPGVPKLYAARFGGGFPLVPKTPACDLGAGACEGAGSAGPKQSGAGSAAFAGPGNPKPKTARRCPKGRREVRRHGKAHCARRKHHKRNANNNGRTGR